MKHTHGPWTAEGGLASSPARVYDSEGQLVATVEGRWQSSEPSKRAHIIAAAPEAFEALNQIDSYLENMGINDRSIRGKIDEVFAKARGES